MTRINVVPVTELLDEHLRAEWRELTRIPNQLCSGRMKYNPAKIAADYVLGTGHVTFFTDKLEFLYDRYKALLAEGLARGFNLSDMWPVDAGELPRALWGSYEPTEHALAINRDRIEQRRPKNPHFWRAKV